MKCCWPHGIDRCSITVCTEQVWCWKMLKASSCSTAMSVITIFQQSLAQTKCQHLIYFVQLWHWYAQWWISFGWQILPLMWFVANTGIYRFQRTSINYNSWLCFMLTHFYHGLWKYCSVYWGNVPSFNIVIGIGH